MPSLYPCEALYADRPTDRQWIIRAAAELIVIQHRFGWAFSEEIIARASIVDAAGELAIDASLYLAQLGPYGWATLVVETINAAHFAERAKWSF